MITYSDYTLKITKNENELDIDNLNFISFRIFSLYADGLSYFELYLKDENTMSLVGDLFRYLDKITIEIETGNSKIVFKTIVFAKKYFTGGVNIRLVPEYYIDFVIKRQNIYKNDNVMNVVEEILNKFKFIEKKDIEKNFNVDKRYIYLFNVTYYEFFRKYILRYLKSDLASYCFFITKDNEFRLYSLKKIMNKKQVIKISNNMILYLKVLDDKLYCDKFDGLGKKVYYFDWEKGNFKEYIYNINKEKGKSKSNFLIKDVVTNKDFEYNRVDLKNTIGFEKYWFSENDNKVETEAEVVKDNKFGVFIDLNTIGFMDLNPLDLVELNFYQAENNVNGLWIVYNVLYGFEPDSINMQITLANTYYYNKY